MANDQFKVGDQVTYLGFEVAPDPNDPTKNIVYDTRKRWSAKVKEVHVGNRMKHLDKLIIVPDVATGNGRGGQDFPVYIIRDGVKKAV